MPDLLVKLNAEYGGYKTLEDGRKELSFLIQPASGYAFKEGIKAIKGYLEPGKKKLVLQVSKYRKKRSLDQNRLMWKLLGILAEEQGQSSWECYINLLEEFEIHFEYFVCKKEALDFFKKTFRATVVIGEWTNKNGERMLRCKSYLGSSEFDTREMTKFIDRLFDRLAEIGIDTQKEVAYEWDEWITYKKHIAGQKRVLHNETNG